MTPALIPLPRLALAGLLLLVALVLSRAAGLDLERTLAWAALRGTVQLVAVGLGLTLLFPHESTPIVLLALFVMAVVAALTSARQVAAGPPTRRLLPGAFLAIVCAATVALVPVFSFVLPLEPRLSARYVIPIGGMLLSSAMNVVALVFERIFAAAVTEADQIEALLSLGATPKRALEAPVRVALRAALTPTINSLLTVGLVALPGMMTGQIVSGTDPTHAVRYQIVILLQLVAVAAVAGTIAAWVARGLLFDSQARLQRSWS